MSNKEPSLFRTVIKIIAFIIIMSGLSKIERSINNLAAKVEQLKETHNE